MLYYPRKSLDISIFNSIKCCSSRDLGFRARCLRSMFLSPPCLKDTKNGLESPGRTGDSWKKDSWQQGRENYLQFSKLFQTSVDPLCVFFLFTFQQFRAFLKIKYKGLSTFQKINHFWHLLAIHFCLKHVL